MLATFSARPGPPRGRRTDAEGADMFASPVLVEGDPFWDPVAWSWPAIGILLAGTVLATIVRSEERRVGKECRAWGGPEHERKKKESRKWDRKRRDEEVH